MEYGLQNEAHDSDFCHQTRGTKHQTSLSRHWLYLEVQASPAIVPDNRCVANCTTGTTHSLIASIFIHAGCYLSHPWTNKNSLNGTALHPSDGLVQIVLCSREYEDMPLSFSYLSLFGNNSPQLCLFPLPSSLHMQKGRRSIGRYNFHMFSL